MVAPPKIIVEEEFDRRFFDYKNSYDIRSSNNSSSTNCRKFKTKS